MYFRKQNEEPIIIFDFLCLSSHVQRNRYEYFSGGRHNLFIEDFRTIFRTIKGFGAKLVFFIDGPLQNDKYEKWCVRHNSNYDDMLQVLDDIYSNNYNFETLKNKQRDLPLISTVVSALLNAAKEFGDVHKSFYSECDIAIAEYAAENNVLAVVSDDTDYMIFNGNWKFWSAAELEMQEMTTMEYNKKALREHINLSDEQMPLFAAIYGNAWLKVKNGDFDNVMDYIRKIPMKLEQSDIQKIVGDVCKMNRKYKIDDIEECLRYNLDFYNVRNAPKLELNEKLLQNAFQDIHGYIYEILQDLPIKITVLYFDYRVENGPNDFMNYFDLVERLICRQMGVLLKHKNDPKLTRTIITKKSHSGVYEKFQLLEPKWPVDNELPPLNQMLFDKNDEEIRPLKFRLLCWIITDVVKPEELLSIPKDYLVTVLTAIYLLEVI